MAVEDVSTLVLPDGSIAQKANVRLTDEEARLLRQYKKFLTAHGFREGLFCNKCANVHNLDDGVRAGINDHSILIECRCQTLSHVGFGVH